MAEKTSVQEAQGHIHLGQGGGCLPSMMVYPPYFPLPALPWTWNSTIRVTALLKALTLEEPCTHYLGRAGHCVWFG